MALKEIVDQFFISIGLDTKQLDQGIDKAITGTRDRLKGLVTNAIAPALAMLTSGALVNQFADEAVQLDRLSTSLGVNIEQLQAWQGAAEQAGVAGEEVGELFADLNDWMLDADQNQSGAMYEYIEKGLLPAVRNARGEMKSTEQYALEMADAFQAMGTQMATGLGRQIGISQAAMVGFLQQGSAKISADMQRIKEMGVYTKQDAEAARDFQKSVDALERSLKSLLLPIFRLLLPIVTTVADGLNYLTKHTWAFVPAIAGLGAMMLMSLLPSMKKVNAYMRLMRLEMRKFLFNPWTWVIAGLIALGLLLDDLITWANGGEAEFSEFWESIFDNAENAKNKIAEFIDFCKKIGEIAAYLAVVIGAFKVLSMTIGAVSTALEIFRTIAMTGLGPIGLAVLAIATAIMLVVDNWELLTEKFRSTLEWLSEKLQTVREFFKIGGTFNNVVSGKVSLAELARNNGPNLATTAGNVVNAAIDHGDAAQAIPASKITTNNTRNVNLDTQTNINVYGSASKDDYERATEAANGINGYNIAQASASQAGI